MLEKYMGTYRKTYTGYPYPDTELSNIEALQDIFDGVFTPDYIDRNLKEVIQRLNNTFTTLGRKSLRLAELRYGKEFEVEIVASHNNWLLFKTSPVELDSIKEMCRYVVPKRKHSRNGLYGYVILVHRDNPNLGELLKRLGFTGFIVGNEEGYSKYISYFDFALLHKDMAYIPVHTVCLFGTYATKCWFDLWLPLFGGASFQNKLKSSTYDITYDASEWTHAFRDCDDFEKAYYDTNSALYKAWRSGMYTICHRVVSDDINGLKRLKYDVKRHAIVYSRKDIVRYAVRDTETVEYDYKDTFLYKTCYDGVDGDCLYFNMLSMCGHEELCRTVAGYFLKVREVITDNSILVKGCEDLDNYFTGVVPEISKMRLFKTDEDYISDIFLSTHSGEGVIDCSPVVHFLLADRNKHKDMYFVKARGNKLVVTIYPFEILTELSKAAGISLDNSDIRKFLDAEMLSFVRFACYQIVKWIDNNKKKYNLRLLDDLWDYSYELDGIRSEVVVTYGG